MHERLITLAFAIIAGAADSLGGLILVRRAWAARSLRYFVALSAGFMMATIALEMVPESFRIAPRSAPLLLLAGYCAIHLLEHTVVPHFHFGEETHHGEFMRKHTGYSVLLGLVAHTFFDGIAIGAGFALNWRLGLIIFLSILLHKLPEGFTIASVMMASGGGRRLAFGAATLLGVATVVGALVVQASPRFVAFGLPLSAGVTLYVSATDLVPEVNREPGIRMALVFFIGVALFAAVAALAR